MNKKKILFVCLGNICRSPAAKAIMKAIIKKNKFDDKIDIDSAGIIDYHAGEKPDPRMRAAAKNRSYNLDNIARKINPDIDFEKFDYIIALDNEIYYSLLKLDKERKHIKKIFKIVEFSSRTDILEVPDPYYGSKADFHSVINILEDVCSGLFTKIKDDIESENKK